MDRLKSIVAGLDGLEALLIENPIDLFYATGLKVSKGQLIIAHGEAALFVDGRYFSIAREKAPCPVFLSEKGALKKRAFRRLGFDSAFTSYEGYLALQKELGSTELVPIAGPLKRLRACKDEGEIEILKRAIRVTQGGYRRILEVLKTDVSEEEAALEFEIFCRKQGASSLSFEPIIAFGENGAYPHHRAGKSRLKENQLVLIDIGAVVDHYSADMTRMFHFGCVDPKLQEFERIVDGAQKKAIAHVHPGIKAGELDQIVRKEFRNAGVEALFTHSLGHGIGLETHEFPRIKEDGEDRDVVLKPGMVFTIEPGLYQPGLGGIRIEDMILVTETGHQILT